MSKTTVHWLFRLLGLLGGCCWATVPASAQQDEAQQHEAQQHEAQRYDVEVRWLIAMAKARIEIQNPGRGTWMMPILYEYKLFSEWNYNAAPELTPDHFDLIAIVENRGRDPVGEFEVVLYRDKLIGEMLGYPEPVHAPAPDPRLRARWEGPVLVDTQTVESLEGNTAMPVYFNSVSTRELREPLWEQWLWPWEVRYYATVRCGRCSPEHALKSITMMHGL